MRPGRIYTLTNPIDNTVFYVGSTTRSLRCRLTVHIQNALNDPHGNIARYIRELADRPIIEEVESFDSISNIDLRKEELFWLRQFKAWGCPLVNNNKPVNDTDRRYLKISDPEIEYLKSNIKHVRLVCDKIKLSINYSTLHNVIRRGKCIRKVYYEIKYLIKGLQEFNYSNISPNA